MRLGELLIAKKLITQVQLDAALEEQRGSREFLGEIFVRRHVIAEADLMRVLSEQFHIPCADLKSVSIDWKVAMRFSPSLVVEHRILPIKQDETSITVAIVNPLDVSGISQLEELTKGVRLRLTLASMGDMEKALDSYREQMAGRIRKLLE